MKAPNKNYLLIIDYNLTRYDDVKRMTDYASVRYGLDTVLIRPAPTAIDQKVASHIIDLDPRAKHFLTEAKAALHPYAKKITAGLAFSDNAVWAGALLLAELGLDVDSPVGAEAAFSKIKYRQMEKERRPSFFVPDFAIIHTYQELAAFVACHPQGCVLKPSCEGNNRGVIMLSEESSLQGAMQDLSPYLAAGIICEERILMDEEYSWDGIGHLHFITQKLSTEGPYPVEHGQVVSGNIPSKTAALIAQAGQYANDIVGQQYGPFHNEIKVTVQKNAVAVIEPNRRPAGMKIWDLAEKVYGINFYHLWIDQLVNKTLPKTLPLSRGRAAIRMLSAPLKGTLQLPPEIEKQPALLLEKMIATLQTKLPLAISIEWSHFKWNKKSGDWITDMPKDNSEFIAQVCCYILNDEIDILHLFDIFHTIWLSYVQPYIFVKQRVTA